MILTEYITIKITSRNIKYYKSICSWAEVDNEILVHINNLPKLSSTKLAVQCSLCKNIVDNSIKGAETQINNRGKFYCLKCKNKYNMPTLQEVKDLFISSGYIPLFNDYKGKHVKYPCKCVKHPEIVWFKKANDVGNGAGCAICNNENRSHKQLLPIEEVKNLFYLNYLIPSFTIYKGHKESLTFICPYHEDFGEQQITLNNLKFSKTKQFCIYCRRTISPISKTMVLYLRQFIMPWVKDSLDAAGKYCCITYDYLNVEVHHLHSFYNICSEVLNEFKYDLKTPINEYSEKELKIIGELVLLNHYKYGLGVVIRKDLHTLFHSTYGYRDFTKEMFYNFLSDVKEGQYGDYYEEIDF